MRSFFVVAVIALSVACGKSEAEQQAEATAIGQQHANIARAEGLRQANVLEAQGEAEAIRIIDEQLRNNPNYLEWLKTQKWDGKLPLVLGEGGTPFIQIPTEEEEP